MSEILLNVDDLSIVYKTAAGGRYDVHIDVGDRVFRVLQIEQRFAVH